MPTPLTTRIRRSALTLPLAALAALLVFGINETAYHESANAFDSVADRTEARTQLQTLWRRLVDAESGQRGYLLTGRKEYLQPYDEALAPIAAVHTWLAEHYRSDPIATQIVADIGNRAEEKLSEVDTTLRLFKDGKSDAWRELLLTDIGREKMDAVRVASEKLLVLESDRIVGERRSVAATLRISRIGVNAMTVLSLLALYLFIRQTTAFDRAQLEHSLALKTERDRLEVEVGRRTGELTDLARDLHTAREDERNHLARELHDELGALLTAAKLDAARLKRALGPLTPDVENRLQHLNETINHGIQLKRRIIEDLRPSSLSNLGLVAALEIQAREFAQRSELEVKLDLQVVDLSETAQITVYRMIQESLTNVAKYARASTVTISMRAEGTRVHVSVRDDGRGFDVLNTRGRTHGLMGMRYRVEAAGGGMLVLSEPGSGTSIEAWLPLMTLASTTTSPELSDPLTPDVPLPSVLHGSGRRADE